MELRLSYDQRARLELLSIAAGTSTEELLVEAAQLLLEIDACDTVGAQLRSSATLNQKFLSPVELDARFSRLLDK